MIPWFGRDLKGGAEQHAWQVAARLAQRGHSVEVLTTCCRSHQEDWATNHLPAGKTTEPEGFTIRRFPVDPREREQFQRVVDRLHAIPTASLRPGVSPVSNEEAEIFVNELIRSDALTDFLLANSTNFDAFILLPYLYGPVIHGVQAIRNRACLQPCLHDEAYAYLPQVAHTFFAAKRLLFISEGEAELATRLYGPGVIEKSRLVGAGVEPPSTAPIDSQSQSGSDRFVLYLGRKEPGKNTDMLVRAFARFRRVRPNSKLRLVLAGHGVIDSNGAGNWIADKGLISESEKHALLRNCAALAQPSVNESFSRVMMEAWRHGKPVAVHAACRATATEVSRSKGGWMVGSEEEWAAWFADVDCASTEDLAQIGKNGRVHADVLADWDAVIGRYEGALSQLASPAGQALRLQEAPPAVNQFLPNLSPGDAISNQAMFIRDRLRELGFYSDIYVRTIHPLLPPNQCYQFSPAALENTDAAIYHHSIGTDITPLLARFDGPKCLIYHNITPAEFVAPYRPYFAELLSQGRKELGALASAFDVSYGDSQFNAEELKEVGFSNPQVFPIYVSPEKWSFSPDSGRMASLSDGRTNIIFVGRIAPNKKQDDLVRAFSHYLALDPTARLFLVGTVEAHDPYASYLFGLIEHLGLRNSVQVTGSISDAELAAYYRTAHLFWSMSEHEGFCVPLIEAMWFDIPVFAFRSSAIPETLGEAAVMFCEKSDLRMLAATARVLITDEGYRQPVINAQRRQRRAFLPGEITPLLVQLTTRLLQQGSVGTAP